MKQISIFVENKPGRINEVTAVLEHCNINILAMTVADSDDYGILRLLVSDVDTAIECLKRAHFSAKVVDVIAVNVSNIKGSLNKILNLFSDGQISVEYMYGFADGAVAVLVFKTRDMVRAQQLLKENNFQILP